MELNWLISLLLKDLYFQIFAMIGKVPVNSIIIPVFEHSTQVTQSRNKGLHEVQNSTRKSVVVGQTALESPGRLVEMQNLRLTLD